MSIELQRRAVKKALRKTPQTAAELAVKAGIGESGRAISRALSALVTDGEATLIDGRQKKYARA